LPQIRIIKENITVQADPEITLLEAMRLAGLNPDAPCGGQGKCGKCTVFLPGTGESVLACKQKVGDEDTEVLTGGNTKDDNILTDASEKHVDFSPLYSQVCIDVPPCPMGKSISDWTRFREALMSADSSVSADLLPDLYIIRKLTSLIKQNSGRIHVLYTEDSVLEISAEQIPVCMAAFDIGTTTLAGYLLDGTDGRVIASASRLNPQKQYGGDVISRANHALENGVDELAACIREAISAMTEEMTSKTAYSVSDVYNISIAGNTCMHHLFLGLDVDSLVHAPYNPALREASLVDAADLGLRVSPRCKVLMLPNIAGFVGADTTACIISTDLNLQKKWTLLIDIGTNGEMVLAKDGRMAACSTAAGPAFEGVGISIGMRGAEGAISHAEYTENGWKIDVIGNSKVKGICGSGLLDVAAEMLRAGIMDENGHMDGQMTVLAKEEDSALDGPVCLLQKDIRELQMAKAAIRSGIELLSAQMGISVDEIKYVWLAGAFGSFMNSDSACDIGMIPPVLKDRIISIGNAAGMGAKVAVKNKDCWKSAEKLTADVEFLELAVLPDFQDTFVDSLEFGC